jgi:hypothetical protein
MIAHLIFFVVSSLIYLLNDLVVLLQLKLSKALLLEAKGKRAQ